MKNSIIIGDADAIIALSNKVDSNHEKAKHTLAYLAPTDATVLFPLTAICEATTILRRRLNDAEAAAHVIKQVETENFPVQMIERNVFTLALSLYSPFGSKRNTLFDALIAATARQLNTTLIFSFDEWYKKQGFTLVSDLLAAKETAA
jgi:predicted nucleic acid-binding protein